MAHSEKVNVVVEYVGHDDFKDTVPASMAVQSVKTKALNFFDLDVGSADQYELTSNGVAITNSQTHVGSFGTSDVVLVLALAKEVSKGANHA